MRLQGKVAFITGAARGIGKAVAMGMALEGATVMLGDIDGSAAHAAAKDLAAAGKKAAAFAVNVSLRGEVDRVVADILHAHGRIDILVNNAGVASVTSFLDTSETEWDRIMGINLKSVFYCCQAVVPGMIARGNGKIINVASVAAKVGGGLLGTSTYAASKAGMLGLSKGLARELAPYGIHVNSIAPGSITTDITATFMTPQQQAESVKRIPLGRRGLPADLVGAAVFLASNESDFIAGATIDVNGGVRMD